MLDNAERQRMITELEQKMPGFNVAVRAALNSQIKQFKRLEGTIGSKACRAAIDSQGINQEMKDYIYLRMGWL